MIHNHPWHHQNDSVLLAWQNKNARELAVNCIYGTFLLHNYINHDFALQNLWWNIVCLYPKNKNGQIHYRWRGKTDLMSFLTAVWETNQIFIFLTHTSDTASPFRKRFNQIYRTEIWRRKQKISSRLMVWKNRGENWWTQQTGNFHEPQHQESQSRKTFWCLARK